MRKTIKNQSKGITLIALIVTIVVLLILVGIVVRVLSDNDGILERAKWSAYVSEYESVAEATELYRAEKEIEREMRKRNKHI